MISMGLMPCYQSCSKVQAVIPQKSNEKQFRAFDSDMYRWRHLNENFFAELKQYRAIATRYDKRACAFLGGVHLAAIAIWLK
jgi:transposase